jgi:D-glycero-alpha-D-manno-heptose-7-phosphate kinase
MPRLSPSRPARTVINAVAPVRICDLGGWTDTWFAEHGCVLNLAVAPLAQTQVFVRDRRAGRARVTVFAENYGERFRVSGKDSGLCSGKHALLEAAFSLMRVPDDVAIEVHIYSDMPPGASTGTSASVSVALIGALDALTPGRLAPHEVARLAHRIETEKLGLQCGIQDQLCAAFGGVCFLEMRRYPEAVVSPLVLPPEFLWELERRLALVYLGSSHVSSAVHRQVIRELEATGAADPRLEALRRQALRGKDALLSRDFGLLAEAMKTNTEIQASLHAGILGARSRTVIDLARRCRAGGWKLNGAGGDGGSVTVLFGDSSADRRLFEARLAEAVPEARVIPVHLSPHGLRVWTCAPLRGLG